jgi:hypothetical protein
LRKDKGEAQDESKKEGGLQGDHEALLRRHEVNPLHFRMDGQKQKFQKPFRKNQGENEGNGKPYQNDENPFAELFEMI